MIREAVNAVRKAVAHAIAFFAYAFDWPARLLAIVAGRVYPAVPPLTTSPAPAKELGDSPTYTVLRWQDRRHWALYHGNNGGEARRRYEAVKNAQETGRMEFQMTVPGGYVVRDVYENGEW